MRATAGSKTSGPNPAQAARSESTAHRGLRAQPGFQRAGRVGVPQTHVLKNDDRAAAEQAASFLIGAGWDLESDDKQG